MATSVKPSFASQAAVVLISMAFSCAVMVAGGYGNYVRLEQAVETLETQKDAQQHEMARLTDRLDEIEETTTRTQEDVSWMRAQAEASHK